MGSLRDFGLGLSGAGEGHLVGGESEFLAVLLHVGVVVVAEVLVDGGHVPLEALAADPTLEHDGLRLQLLEPVQVVLAGRGVGVLDVPAQVPAVEEHRAADLTAVLATLVPRSYNDKKI